MRLYLLFCFFWKSGDASFLQLQQRFQTTNSRFFDSGIFCLSFFVYICSSCWFFSSKTQVCSQKRTRNHQKSGTQNHKAKHVWNQKIQSPGNFKIHSQSKTANYWAKSHKLSKPKFVYSVVRNFDFVYFWYCFGMVEFFIFFWISCVLNCNKHNLSSICGEKQSWNSSDVAFLPKLFLQGKAVVETYAVLEKRRNRNGDIIGLSACSCCLTLAIRDLDTKNMKIRVVIMSSKHFWRYNNCTNDPYLKLCANMAVCSVRVLKISLVRVIIWSKVIMNIFECCKPEKNCLR